MKKIFLIAIMYLSVTLFSDGQEKKVYENGYLVKTGDMAPDFMINEAGGKSYRLSDLKGKVVMLQFTASWCSVCRTEMPFIEKEIWQEKKGQDLLLSGLTGMNR